MAKHVGVILGRRFLVVLTAAVSLIGTVPLAGGHGQPFGVGAGNAYASASLWRDRNFADRQNVQVNAAVVDQSAARVFALMGAGGFERVIAYDRGTGRVIWARTFARNANGVTEAFALLVPPGQNTVFVGGGYLDGSTDSGQSAGFVFAFDARTGRTDWSYTQPFTAGIGGFVTHLVAGPGGSVVALTGALNGSPQNDNFQYAATVTDIGRSGLVRWTWVDNTSALITGMVATAQTLVVVGDRCPDGSSNRGYGVAVDLASGQLLWRRSLTGYATQFAATTASNVTGRVYLAGVATNDGHGAAGGGRAFVMAVDAGTGDRRWTRYVGSLGSNRSFDYADVVIDTSDGPCITGGHDGTDANYNPILPDNGFIACYRPSGRRRWIDQKTGAQGRVLALAGDQLLWSGRQETSRDKYSGEVTRFETRSLKTGVIQQRSSRRGHSYIGSPSIPLLARVRNGTTYFFVATGVDPDAKTPFGFLRRTYGP